MALKTQREIVGEPEVVEEEAEVVEEAAVVKVKKTTSWWPAQVVDKMNEDFMVKILNNKLSWECHTRRYKLC